ncbi:MAG: extracellular solute-binding protein [Candidatus Pristimantibacillus lignocellulolyticus]|uniref:Extracellular solute-binding protein n=1 Tax=Candidatus Pristimantibacillus lignocellulolyticus TaxID=2994561 RepID=A0A9J6ZD52_9BACL|nr:MAG: extracellular solute-binding protein [Candidatus Pristimantibacillus lignocellulolyticus]
MKQKKWLKFSFGTVMAMVMIFLAACGNQNASNNAGSKNGSSSSDEVITLTMMHPWTSPNVDNEVYKARIAAFEEKFPNIKIEQDGVAAAQYKTKLFTLATANNISDINVVWPGADLDPLVKGDLLLPLNDYMDNWNDVVLAESLVGYNANGNQLAIPTKRNFVDIIYYNKEYLEQVGYTEFPTTYEEFISMIKKLKEANITPISLGNKEKWPLQSSFMSIIGQRFAGTDFLAKVMAGEAKLTDPQYVKAIAVIEELTALEAFNVDANNMDSVQAQDYLIQGKAAMHMSSATVDGRIRTTNEEGDKFGIALFPSVPGGLGDPKESAGVAQFGISIKNGLDEKKQAAALEFMKFFVHEELYVDLAKAGILVPANVEMGDDISPYLKEMYELTSHGTAPVFDAVINTQAAKEIENGLQALTVGRSNPEEVAADAQALIGK